MQDSEFPDWKNPTHTQGNAWVYEEENTHGDMKPQNARDKEPKGFQELFHKNREHMVMEIQDGIRLDNENFENYLRMEQCLQSAEE